MKPAAALTRLESLVAVYTLESAREKRDLVAALLPVRLPDARSVVRLHELLCFLRAYPDDRRLLRSVERGLRAFSERRDLRRHREDLAGSGIAGTPIDYRLYWIMARWLVRHWPDRLAIDWEEFDGEERLAPFLAALVPPTDRAALESSEWSGREWIEAMKAPRETDAGFLVRRIDAIPGEELHKETLFEFIDAPYRLMPGPGAPSRTTARYPKSPVVFRTAPLRRDRPDLGEALRRPPLTLEAVSSRDGARLIGMARESMLTRARDLDIFAFADSRDVRLADCGDGLQFACFGARPERRTLFDVVSGYITLQNGVPIGYVQSHALLGSAGLAYNVFETFRGAEAAYVFGRMLATVGAVTGADAFHIDPYQLGSGNEEGQRSGAWWFYYKLGFRPEEPQVKRLLARELKAMQRNPKHRSSPATLVRLAEDNLYWDAGAPRPDTVGRISLSGSALVVSRYLAERFGGRREHGLRTCADEAATITGAGSRRSWSAAEREAWRRWAPVVLTLDDVPRWTDAEKRDLVAVIRAKGGRRESDFIRRFDAHRRLRAAIVNLATRSS